MRFNSIYLFEDISIFAHAFNMADIKEADIIKRLKTARENAKMSQLELSYKSGVSQNMITYIETGKSSPTLTTILKLCHALNISPAVLFEETAEEKKEIKEQIHKLVNLL